MDWVQDLTLHVDALLAAMESDKKFFAPVIHYVRELKRLLSLPGAHPSKSSFVTPAKKIKEFWDSYRSDHATPGYVYIPPHQTSNTESTVYEIYSLITKLSALPDEKFIACFRPAQPKVDPAGSGNGASKGRLGFEKAVLLKQAGVEELSNLAGLQYIAFNGDNIEQAFYELRRVLQREGMLVGA